MTLQRRQLLKTIGNPDSRHDYVVDYALILADGTRLTLRFVPDRDVLAPDCLPDYVAGLEPDGLEALALTVVEDLANELIPRWVEVRVERRRVPYQRVTVEDSQPGWSNPDLISRLRDLTPLASPE